MMNDIETNGIDRVQSDLMLRRLCQLLGEFARTDLSCREESEGTKNDDEVVDDDEGKPITTRLANGVDVGAWTTWTLTGLKMFSGQLPRLDTLTAASRRVLLIAATQRFGGNITHIAAALGTSRRSIRNQLKGAGLYPPERMTMQGLSTR